MAPRAVASTLIKTLMIHSMAPSEQFSVIKSEGELVLPSDPTPTHTLPFSYLDLQTHDELFVEMFLMYKRGHQPALLIKQALAKALVAYYPLAGRIVRPPQRENTHVACTGDGVFFVDATADCDLDDIMDLLTEKVFPREELLPSHHNPVGMSIMLQVTEFKCGGFVVGLKYHHIMADGTGMGQIMRAIAETARGLKVPTVEPIWLREHLPDPPDSESPLLPLKRVRSEYLMVDVSQDHINKIKEQFMAKTGQTCSSLDVVVAELWRCRLQAIGLDEALEAQLVILADTRSLLSRFLPGKGGYYGNCTSVITVAVPSGKVAQASTEEVLSLIREAKKGFSDQFLMGGLKGEQKPIKAVGDFLVVTDWRRLGFSEVDFGWGAPAYFAPLLSKSTPEEISIPCITTIVPALNNEGLRMLVQCSESEHFEDQMMNFSTNVKIVRLAVRQDPGQL